MSERDTIRDLVTSAETIVVPSGRDYAKCIDALKAECDIDVPDFPDRCYKIETNGQTWRMAKGKDVPARVARGFAQVGLTGTDVLRNQSYKVTTQCLRFDEPELRQERPESARSLGWSVSEVRSRYWPLGAKMCEFSLLAPIEACDELREWLNAPVTEPLGKRSYLEVVTSLPFLLSSLEAFKRLEQKVYLSKKNKITGSVEGAVGWIAPLGADLVETGTTLRANELGVVNKLTDIYPAVFTCEPAPFVITPPPPITGY